MRQTQKMKSFYSHFIGKGDLCFDVGANLGNRAEVFLALGATVVAIETAGGASRSNAKQSQE